jgi:hypothetical protein
MMASQIISQPQQQSLSGWNEFDSTVLEMLQKKGCDNSILLSVQKVLASKVRIEKNFHWYLICYSTQFRLLFPARLKNIQLLWVYPQKVLLLAIL